MNRGVFIFGLAGLAVGLGLWLYGPSGSPAPPEGEVAAIGDPLVNVVGVTASPAHIARPRSLRAKVSTWR